MRNNYNGDNRQELYNNQYRKKQRRKMRRRRVAFYTVTGLVFAVGLFFAGDYVMGILQKTDSSPIPQKHGRAIFFRHHRR